jgi:molecular chaperone DnaK (HSP70)
MTKDNVLLGKFELTGIPPAPRGVPKIEVTFELDADSILHVTAQDLASQNAQTLEIKADSGGMSKADIERKVITLIILLLCTSLVQIHIV